MRALLRTLSVLQLCLAAVLLSQCADPNEWPQKFQFGTSDTLVVGANIRTVSERARERPSGIPNVPPLPTVCTEPSPDVAIAFGRSLSAQGSLTEGSNTGSAQLSASTTETATALAGRTAGVLALRDGLYAACQAYTNGVLGQDAYAMVLSQYGNLLVALANSGTNNVTPYATYSPQDAATATLLVTCISEYDPTRLAAINRDGALAHNPMLSPQLCQALLAKIANGRPLAVGAPAPARKKAEAPDPDPTKTKTAQAGGR